MHAAFLELDGLFPVQVTPKLNMQNELSDFSPYILEFLHVPTYCIVLGALSPLHIAYAIYNGSPLLQL